DLRSRRPMPIAGGQGTVIGREGLLDQHGSIGKLAGLSVMLGRSGRGPGIMQLLDALRIDDAICAEGLVMVPVAGRLANVPGLVDQRKTVEARAGLRFDQARASHACKREKNDGCGELHLASSCGPAVLEVPKWVCMERHTLQSPRQTSARLPGECVPPSQP